MSLAHDPTADDQFTVDLDAKGLKSRALLGSVLSGGAQIAKLILQLGSTVVLGRLLFPEDFGLVAMVYPIIGFVQLFGYFGFGEAIIQRQDLRHEDVSSLFWLNLLIGLGLALAGAALSPLAAWMYGEPQIIPVMAAIAAILPFSALGSIHSAILARQMRFGTIARNELTATLLGVIATIGCAVLNLGYWSLVIGQATTTLVAISLAWASLRWRPLRPALSSEVWAYVRFGANQTGANLATFLTSSGDNIIVGALIGKQALGLYDRSYRLVVQPLGQMLVPISSVAVPLLSRLQSDPLEYKKAYLNFVRLILLFSMPIMVVCITNAGEVVALLLGPRWGSAAPVFAWLSVGGLLGGFYSSLSWLFISQAKTPSMRRYMLVAAALNLASFAFGAMWGIVGVAICAAIVFTLVTVPLVTFGATRSGPVTLRDVALCCLPHVLTAAAAFLLVKLAATVFQSGDLPRLLISIALCAGIFLVVSLILPAERQMIRFGWSKIAGLRHRRHLSAS